MKYRLVFVFIAFVFSSFTSHYPMGIQEKSTFDKELMLKLVNSARTKGCNCGDKYFSPVPALAWNEQLEKAAIAHTKDMSQKKFFSHTGADGSTVATRMEKAGYKWISFGENIGLGYQSEQEAVEAWLKSPGHCKNMMSPKFKEIGVARMGEYWTQVFGAK